jgi:hypothetical protein
VTRSVRLLAPLAADLAEWRLASRRPNPEALIFRSSAGREWSDFDWRKSRKRVFSRAAQAVGLGSIRPYDLRHSFVSLLLAEGLSVVEVAGQAGHSPMMALNTYGHVIEELAGAERRSAEEAIRKARDELVPLTYPQRPRRTKPANAESSDLQEHSEEPTRGLEPRTPSKSVGCARRNAYFGNGGGESPHGERRPRVETVAVCSSRELRCVPFAGSNRGLPRCRSPCWRRFW